MRQHSYASGTGSAAALLGHPLHPVIVPLPIGAVIGTFICDVAFAYTGQEGWAVAASWMLLVALVAGAVAAFFGLVEFASISRARSMGIAWAHGAANVVLLALLLVSYILRRGDPVAGAWPVGITFSSVAFVLVLVSGWLGGELAFRHGVGVDRAVGRGEAGSLEKAPSGRDDIGLS
ncbi:hypothetical protein BN1110_04841 [bacterium YEK0313]|nr:hypothetical protein BN1110_04841 [bacterium YEK0313]